MKIEPAFGKMHMCQMCSGLTVEMHLLQFTKLGEKKVIILAATFNLKH